MSLSRVKTWISEVLTASDLNAEFNSILNFINAGVFVLTGTTTNDSAAAGVIGEFTETVVQSISPVALVNGVAKDVATISLTAGDWDVAGLLQTAPAGATVTSVIQAGFNTVANTLPSFERQVINGVNNAANIIATAPLPRMRFSLSATTTIRMVAQVAFSVSAMSACGYINARRVR